MVTGRHQRSIGFLHDGATRRQPPTAGGHLFRSEAWHLFRLHRQARHGPPEGSLHQPAASLGERSGAHR
eukprot:1512555-Pyramimonas_sp.AAC.1